MDVFVNKTDQFCQVVIGFRTSNSPDDKQRLKSAELPQRASERVLRQGQEPRRARGAALTAHERFHPRRPGQSRQEREEPGRAIRAPVEQSAASAPSQMPRAHPSRHGSPSKDAGHPEPAKPLSLRGPVPSHLGAGLQGALNTGNSERLHTRTGLGTRS